MGGHLFSPRFCPEVPVVGRALVSTRDPRRAEIVKKPEEAMEILEAYDLTGSLRGAAALGGITRRWRTGSGCGRRRVVRRWHGRGIGGPWRTRSRRRSRSWSIARAGGSAPIRR